MSSYGQGYFYTPDDSAQIDALERKRKLALALQQQGSQDPGDTPYAGLASAGKSIAGALMANGLDEQQRAVSTNAQDRYTRDMAAFLKGGDVASPAPGSPPQGIQGPSPQVSNTAGPDMPTEESVGQPQPIPNATGPAPSPSPIPNAQGPAPAPVNMQSPMARLLATGNPALIQQFAPQLFTHQLDINDRKVVPISDAEAKQLGLRPGGVYGREAATGNLTTIQPSDMKSAGAIQQGLNEKIDEARLVPMTAAEIQAHKDRQAALAVTENQPHFVPYGTSSYIQNGKVMQVPGGMGGAGSSPFGTGDAKATSLQGQLGLSTAGLNYLLGNTSALGQRDKQMAAREVDQLIARTGLDQSTIKAKVGAFNNALNINTLKSNTMDTLSREIEGTIQNFAPIADKINPGNIRFINGIAQVIGSQANTPEAQQYVTYLNQMRADLAGFNAVSGGKIGLHGQVQTDNADFATAEKVIQNGLSSGGARGLAKAIADTRAKNVAIVEHQSNEAQRGIWNALGIGGNFDAVHPGMKPPPAAPSGGGNTGGKVIRYDASGKRIP